MPDDLYERDILEWSIIQADRLRRLRSGERPNDVDWDNLIEEVEAVGRSQTLAVRSLLRRGLEHLLKVAGWPDADPGRHWLAKARSYLRDARDAYAASMRQHIEIAEMFADARQSVLILRIDGKPPATFTDTCPVTLDDLLDPAVDVAELASRLRARPN